MNNNKQLKLGIILNYVNILAGSLIPILYTPIMLRLLGQDEYGLYKLAASVTSYLGLMSLGLGSAVTRYLIKAQSEEGKEAEERVLGLFLIVFRVIAIATFAVGVCLTFTLGIWYSDSLSSDQLQKIRILIFILTLNTSLTLLLSPYISVIGTHERFVFQQAVNIASTLFLPLLNLIALALGFASVGLTISSLVVNIGINGAYLVYIRKKLKIKPQYKNLPKDLLKEIIIFSFWIFVADIVSQLYNSTDTIMIGMIPELSTGGVAVYNVGTTFMNIMFTMTIGISSLLSPKTNKMVFSGADSTELTDLAIKYGRLQGYIATLIATGFIAFGQPFLHFYAGDGYQQAYWVAVVVMVPNLIPLVQSICYTVVVARNKHKFRSLTYLGIAIANVIGTWFLMQTELGIVGAAMMTGFALLIGQGLIMNWYYQKKMKLEMGRFWKSIVKIYIVPIILCVCTLLISKVINFYSIPVLLGGIVLYTILFFALNWIFVMNDSEKDIVRSSLHKKEVNHENN